MLDNYFQKERERETMGIPAPPLTPEEVAEVCAGLENPPTGLEEKLLDLIKNRVAPGVDPSAKNKADWLAKIARGERKSPLISPIEAVKLLGTMLGGYNVDPLVNFLDDPELAETAAEALKRIILVYGAFQTIVEKAKTNPYARKVLESWANGEWFLSQPEIPEKIVVKIFKVDGEINTDDLSPAKHAWSRPDIPLHSLSMGETRFPGGIKIIKQFRDEGFKVAFVGDVVGTGSSRKSACNSLMWHIGEDIPFVPNKRRGGIILAGLIAPIFFNTVEDSGGLPLMITEVTSLKTGDIVTLNTKEGTITNDKSEVISYFEFKPPTLHDEFRAGGRLNLIIGRDLTNRARKVLGLGAADFFTKVNNPKPKPGQGYTLAQKIVGQACGLEGVLPGTACEAKMTTVGSQDTTGPMTMDELKELACLQFQTEFFMQSFCHTAAYPTPADVKMHQILPEFIISRGGVALRPGDGVIHSWINRFILPDTVGTGGDSHTRFPLGLSFPAGSGLVAFAGALGFMPLDMPESVLVKFKGKLQAGITLRDVVNAIPYFAIKQGLLTVAKKGKKNIFNGRIIEMEGLEDLTVEQAYELTNATAERSAAGAVIALKEENVVSFLHSNIALMEKMIEEGYQSAETLRRRIEACRAWLDNPKLLRRDENAEYVEVIEVNLDEITQPILACPNDPDDVRLLSEVAGDKIDEVFIGSCMTNIGHFRAVGKILEGAPYLTTKVWLAPPSKMDAAQLMREGYFAIFASVGARIETPGCSLCMGNQARVRPKSTVFSTSTRNFDDRMGDGARVYLGSAELGALCALKGEIPTPEEYLAIMEQKILPQAEKIYRCLDFDEMREKPLHYSIQY